MTACLICAADFDGATDYEGRPMRGGAHRRHCSHDCRRAAHNARYTPRTRTVDEVAVERACQGDRTVALTRAEKHAAFRQLFARGLSAAVVADRLGMTTRAAERHRPKSTPAPPPARKEPVMPPPVTGWSVNQKAATVVQKHALDDGDDCRALLEACGLIPEGLEVVRRSDVLPDDTRNYDVEGNAPDSGSTIGWRKVAPEPRADRRFVPDGLAS